MGHFSRSDVVVDVDEDGDDDGAAESTVAYVLVSDVLNCSIDGFKDRKDPPKHFITMKIHKIHCVFDLEANTQNTLRPCIRPSSHQIH